MTATEPIRRDAIRTSANTLRRAAEYTLPPELDQRLLDLMERKETLAEDEKAELMAWVRFTQQRSVDKLSAEVALQSLMGGIPRTRGSAVSAFSPTRRAAVVERAGHHCEYCHLPIRGQVATFPIDHVLPRSLGGTQELENLALTCPHCNAHKWTSTEGVDPETGNTEPLFYPRRQD